MSTHGCHRSRRFASSRASEQQSPVCLEYMTECDEPHRWPPDRVCNPGFPDKPVTPPMMVAIFRASRKDLLCCGERGTLAEHLLALFPRHRAAADRLGKQIIGYGLALLTPLG